MKHEEHPVDAFQLRSNAELELGDNGESASTAPVRLVARTGQPIKHAYWGNIVHDLEGMRIPGGRNRIALDYNHDPSQIVGYANHFDSSSGDLVLSGALVPYRNDDTASRIIHLAKNNVPFEASISFADPDTDVQVVAEGETTPVNGYEFTGPGVVVRRWSLRSCAICPSGADSNTSVSLFSSSDRIRVNVVEGTDMNLSEQFTAEKIENELQDDIQEVVEEQAEDVEAEVTPEAVDTDSDQDSAEAADDSAAVEAQEPEPAHLAARSIMQEFGLEGLALYAEGLTREQIQYRLFCQLKDELETLRKQLAKRPAVDEPAHFSSSETKDVGLPLPIRIHK